MKQRLLLTSVALMCIAASAAQNPGDEQVVSKLQAAIYEAYAKGDSATIDQMLASDYTHNDLRGGMKDRPAYMAYIHSVADAIKSGAVKIDSSGVDDLRIRIYGDTAVATGRWSAQGEKGSNKTSEQLRFTYVWVRRSARWQAVAGQVTPIAPK